jgi:acyl-CoA synthetase (AMP-forming)/AMP-acid ligase II
VTLVHRFLQESARGTPDAVALIDGRGRYTYAEIESLSNRFANLFLDSGVSRGDRVVIALENSAEFLGAYFGAMKAGAVAVPLPAGPRSDRLARAVADCSPKVCVLDSASDIHGLDEVPSVFVARDPARVTSGGSYEPRDLAAELRTVTDRSPAVRSIDLDLAAIVYTSGSTGEPRGVMLTHRNIVSNTRSIIRYLQLTARDRVMCVLPFYYVYGLSLLHTHVAVGGSVVVENRFAFPNIVLNAMQQHEVTGFAGVPSSFALLLHRSALDEIALPALRYVTQAGGAMPKSRIVEWLDRGPKVPFYVMYGATEASARLTYLEPEHLGTKLGSIGRPVPNVEILVLRDDGTPAAPGEIGELVARGSNISPGYWNNHEESRQKFDATGYHTGDLGYMDDDGFLFLAGRRHDMIKVGAHRVGSKEIEDVLHEYQGVHDAAVVAVPDALLGEVPVAFVAWRSAVEIGALQAFCRTRLPAHKMPVRFISRAELPKIAGVGKIDRTALRDLAMADLGTGAAL